jgi:hypothetical protein
MASQQVEPKVSGRMTYLEMTFSTADQERMVFYGTPVAGTAQVPTHLHLNTRLTMPATAAAKVILGPLDQVAPTVPDRIAVVEGNFVTIDPGSPPNAIPFDESAGLLRLARQ